MFTVEKHSDYSAYNKQRHVIDHDQDARLQLINGSAQTGQDLFLLTPRCPHSVTPGHPDCLTITASLSRLRHQSAGKR